MPRGENKLLRGLTKNYKTPVSFTGPSLHLSFSITLSLRADDTLQGISALRVPSIRASIQVLLLRLRSLL
jgi:hypothetical protein